MEHLYIDESGSMTVRYIREIPMFVIAIVRATDPNKLRKMHKRFVAKHASELLAADKDHKMHENGKFKELKGSAFTPDLKRSFVSYFCQENTLDVFYVAVDNRKIDPRFYANTARAFNYVLRLAVEHFIRNGLLPDDLYMIQLDERNERTETKFFLQNYLNTELMMSGVLSTEAEVKYFDSSQNKLIQVADVFANLYFSQERTGNYSEQIQRMRDTGTLKYIFRFPL